MRRVTYMKRIACTLIMRNAEDMKFEGIGRRVRARRYWDAMCTELANVDV